MKKIITTILIALCFSEQSFAFAASIAPKEEKTAQANAVYLDRETSSDAFSNINQSMNKFFELSPIEQMFNSEVNRKNGVVLKQIGYDFFNPQKTAGGSSTGKFDNNYRLSLGEKLTVYLYGDSVDVMAVTGSSLLAPTIKTEVDSKGNIFLSGIGVVSAENKTISEVESSINKLASAKYKNLTVKVNVTSGQDFSVFVYGHVKKPGKVLLSNNSSFVEAISMAGGIKKTGSLRNIKYTTNKKTRTIDLYKVLLSPEAGDIMLRPNDKIFVESVGNVVAIKNGVTVPGIYEAKEGETVTKLVGYAGGLLPGTLATEVVLTRLEKTTKERRASSVNWSNAKITKVYNGDSIEFKGIYNDAENIVTIQGNIKHPATYAYKDGMRLSDILKDEKELKEETFLSQAVIRRISGKDNTIETIPIFLKEFFDGTNNPLLKPRDVITVYKNTNALFVDVYGCINTPKHLVYTENMRLSDILSDIKFVESNIEDIDPETKEVNYSKTPDDSLIEVTASRTAKLLSAENVAVEITHEDDTTQIFYLYDIMINTDKISSISLLPNDKVLFRTLRDNETLKTVKVSGFVNQPGVYKFIDGKRLKDMIELAGGLSKDADLRGLVFKRKAVRNKQIELAKKNNARDIKLLEGRMISQYGASQSATEAKQAMLDSLKADQYTIAEKYDGQIALNIKTVDNLDKIRDIDNLYVQDGDDIYIPRIPTHVSVIGEVYNEMAFNYIKGANAKKYIKEIGGYTPNANKFRLYRISVNGRAEKIGTSAKIEPGDTIIVPRKVAGNEWIDPASKALAAIANCAIAVVALFSINK